MPLAFVLPDSPEGSSETGHPIPRWMLNVSVTLVLLSAAIYALIYFNGAGFENLFEGFGADLPMITRVVLTSYKWYGILVMVGVVPSFYMFKNRTCFIGNRNRLFARVVASFGLALFMLGVVTAAVYLPIFQMGAVVQ